MRELYCRLCERCLCAWCSKKFLIVMESIVNKCASFESVLAWLSSVSQNMDIYQERIRFTSIDIPLLNTRFHSSLSFHFHNIRIKYPVYGFPQFCSVDFYVHKSN